MLLRVHNISKKFGVLNPLKRLLRLFTNLSINLTSLPIRDLVLLEEIMQSTSANRITHVSLDYMDTLS